MYTYFAFTVFLCKNYNNSVTSHFPNIKKRRTYKIGSSFYFFLP
nr:MAG TPA: hypothetical protein [Caudoviricetes sp.]